MVDPIGAAIGTASLVIQLLDGAIKGYAFFLAVGKMDESCLDFRTKLEIEQCRILDFAQVAGLLDYTDEQELPDVLKAEKLVLVAVFNQIEAKLQQFTVLTTRYKQLEKNDDHEKEAMDMAVNLEEAYSSLRLKWHKAATKREHLRGTNHLVKYYKIGKDIVTDPKRLRWTAFDRKTFAGLLKDLTEYNNYLHELLHGEYAKKLEEATRKTYLEMVLVRGELDDLKRLLVTSMLLKDHEQTGASPRAAEANRRNYNVLNSLARTKLRSIVNDESDKQKPPEYRHVIDVGKLSYNAVDIDDPPEDSEVVGSRKRSSGKYWPGNGTFIEVWIEWKKYITHRDEKTGCDVPLSGNVERVRGLVSLLQSSSLGAFRVPHCIGYFDYREDDPKSSTHPEIFGIVYQKPHQPFQSSESMPPTTKSPDPVSLFAAFSNAMPSLSDRMALAYHISNSLLYLNSVRWFHKSLRSDAIVFNPSPDSDAINLHEPFVTGFEYARPDNKNKLSTYIPANPGNELYVHPDYQGSDAGEGYVRSFDIYALGIILIEIAYWKPIRDILKDEFYEFKEAAAMDRKGSGIVDSEKANPKVIADDAKNVRHNLLDPTKPYLPRLRATMGNRYYNAVQGCIEGFVGVADEDDVHVSVKLQQQFTEQVVESLGDVTV